MTNRPYALSCIGQEEKTHGTCGPLASDRAVREKLAIASAETYKMLRTDMSEIIKTSDWKRARGVGFTEVNTLDNAVVVLKNENGIYKWRIFRNVEGGVDSPR